MASSTIRLQARPGSHFFLQSNVTGPACLSRVVMTVAIKAAAWDRARWGRLIAVAVIVPLLACALAFISAMQGDTDLPPYDPPNTLDRLCWAGSAVLVWPAALAVKLGVPVDVHPVVIWSLFWSSGLLWAALLELILIAKNARRS